MKIRTVVPIVAALLMTPVVRAQSAATSAAPNKVGIINIQAAILSTGEGKQASAELQSQFAPRTAELQSLQKQIADIQNRLQTGATTLSEEETARLTDQGQRLSHTLQRKQQDDQDDFNDARQDAVNRIGRKMMAVLDKYAKEHGYSVILDTSSQQTPVIYASNQVDLTEELVHLYDQAYPVKTSAPAAPAKKK
ncbi:MAG TPA: OmpH family outer membrane protein [Candidatus Dormibacteraeota bacterium]|nr:OmpH family outer membrane protein [Candidatus Dormibacteraeota bacterium]